MYLDSLPSLEDETGWVLLLEQSLKECEGRYSEVDINEFIMNPAVWGVLGSVISGLIAYKTASKKTNLELSVKREAYVDTQLQGLLNSYKTDLGELKIEIRELTEKNQLLVTEVLNLKVKIMELEGKQNDSKTCESTRS